MGGNYTQAECLLCKLTGVSQNGAQFLRHLKLDEIVFSGNLLYLEGPKEKKGINIQTSLASILWLLLAAKLISI